MIHFYQSAFMEALGWSLVDSFWKIGSLWITYILITGNGKWFSAATRYLLAVSLISAGTAWSFVNISFYYNEILSGNEISSLGAYFKNGFAFAEQIIPWLSSLYILLVSILSGRLVYQYFAGRKLIYANAIEADASIVNLVSRLADQIHIRKKIGVYISENITSPLTVGFIKPMILLPVAMFSQLSIEQTRSVIAHELFHIRRNDFLINILVSISGVILFFNPFARLLGNIIKKEREHVCDDQVIANGFDQWQYAHALYLIGRNNAMQNPFVMAAAGHKTLLLERIGRILERSVAKKNFYGSDLMKPLAIFVLCITGSLFLGRTQRTSSDVDKPVSINSYAVATRTVEAIPAGRHQQSLVIHRQSTVIIVKKKVKKAIDKHLDLTSVSPDMVVDLAPPPPMAPEPEEVYNHFVSSADEPLEFSLEVPEAPSAPEIAKYLDPSAPYIPSSTFYHSVTIDSVSKTMKRTVHL